jgi:hypothetical protein
MDEDYESMILTSVREALARSPKDIAEALRKFGWSECAAMDEPFAFTALFEQQGHLGVASDALDLAAATVLGIDSDVAVVWPVGLVTGDNDEVRAIHGRLEVDGIALRSVRDPDRRLLVPAADSVHQVESLELEESALGGMASDSDWVRVRGEARSTSIVGSWTELVPRCRLAVASELVGLAQLILDVATEQVSTRQQFGRTIGANQAVRFQLAEGYAGVSGARALIAVAWEDGSADSASWAREVAGAVHGLLAKVAIQVCGAIGLSEEHQLPRLVRRGFALDTLVCSREEPWTATREEIAPPAGRSPEIHESVGHF